jgi:hypothetical protein
VSQEILRQTCGVILTSFGNYKEPFLLDFTDDKRDFRFAKFQVSINLMYSWEGDGSNNFDLLLVFLAVLRCELKIVLSSGLLLEPHP